MKNVQCLCRYYIFSEWNEATIQPFWAGETFNQNDGTGNWHTLSHKTFRQRIVEQNANIHTRTLASQHIFTITNHLIFFSSLVQILS